MPAAMVMLCGLRVYISPPRLKRGLFNRTPGRWPNFASSLQSTATSRLVLMADVELPPPPAAPAPAPAAANAVEPPQVQVVQDPPVADQAVPPPVPIPDANPAPAGGAGEEVIFSFGSIFLS